MHVQYLPSNASGALGHVVEEAGEVQQAIGKVLRFGWDSRDPTKPNSDTNAVHLLKELSDLQNACQRLSNFMIKEGVCQKLSNIYIDLSDSLQAAIDTGNAEEVKLVEKHITEAHIAREINTQQRAELLADIYAFEDSLT